MKRSDIELFTTNQNTQFLMDSETIIYCNITPKIGYTELRFRFDLTHPVTRRAIDRHSKSILNDDYKTERNVDIFTRSTS